MEGNHTSSAMTKKIGPYYFFLIFLFTCVIIATLHSGTTKSLCNLIGTVCVSFQGILMPNLEIWFFMPALYVKFPVGVKVQLQITFGWLGCWEKKTGNSNDLGKIVMVELMF